MLVIRRRAGESLLIGDEIEIEILECTHSQVKIGIRAPKEVVILRKEIQVTRDQNRIAAGEITAEAITQLHSILPNLSRP
jgi:carbon storage regulator